MKKVVKSSQIKEIALNSAYHTEDEVENLITQGVPGGGCRKMKKMIKNIFILTIEE